MPEKRKDSGKVITMASSKKEMLEAYQKVLKELEEKQAGSGPEKKMEEKKAEEVVKIATTLSCEGVVQGISNLRNQVSKLLTELMDKLEEQVNRFHALQQAIQLKEKELQELYEIEKTAQTMTALVESQRRRQIEFEEEMARLKEELNREIENTRQDWEKEKQQHEAELKEQEAAEKKRREREKEEYLYSLNREKQIARDRAEDEKVRLERELQLWKEEKEKEIAEREKALQEKEAELELWKKKVESFPQQLEQAVARAVEETREKLEKEALSRLELVKKEFLGEKNVAQARIEFLEKTVQQQEAEIEKLSRQLETAYKRIEDIAVKSVSNLPGWKISADQEKNENLR